MPGGTISLIDESYNANPASMKAALELAGAAPVRGSGRRHRRARRHAGARRATRRNCMPGWRELITGKHIDLVLLAGPEMKALAEKLAGRTRESSTGLTSRN